MAFVEVPLPGFHDRDGFPAVYDPALGALRQDPRIGGTNIYARFDVFFDSSGQAYSWQPPNLVRMSDNQIVWVAPSAAPPGGGGWTPPGGGGATPGTGGGTSGGKTGDQKDPFKAISDFFNQHPTEAALLIGLFVLLLALPRRR